MARGTRSTEPSACAEAAAAASLVRPAHAGAPANHTACHASLAFPIPLHSPLCCLSSSLLPIVVSASFTGWLACWASPAPSCFWRA